jgi:hypothetical protein
MKVRGIYRTGILLILLLGVSSSFAQEYEDVIYLKDGGVRRGLIQEQVPNEAVKLKTSYGEIFVITWSEISRIVKEEKTAVLTPNSHYTRYFFVPNAFPLKKTSGYLQTTYLMGWSANYGVSDYTSIGFLTTLFGQPFIVTPKIGVKVSDNWHVGGGVLLGYIGDPFGITYGLSTWGNREKNVTVALGWAFGGGEIHQSPMLSVNAMTRISKSWMLMVESWMLTDEASDAHICLYGVRWHRGGKNSLDAGFAIHREVIEDWNNQLFPGFPFLNWTYGF